MKHSIPNASAVFASLALVVLLTSCGTEPSESRQPRAGTDSAEVRAEAERVYQAFAGTLAQQNAGEVLRAHAGNGPMDACLEKLGYPQWDWSLSRGYAAPFDPLSPTEWFAELGRRVYSEKEIAARDYLAAEAVMNTDAPRSEDYERAIDQCLADTDPVGEADVDQAGRPADTQELIETWWTVLAEAGVEYGGSFDEYYACMDDADIPVLDAEGASYSDIAQVMARRAVPAPAPGQDPDNYSSEWVDFLAAEDQVIAADTGCRKDVYTRGIADIAPVIAAFEREHADEIDQAKAGWEEIVAHAKRLGYTGQRGPLGK